MHSSVAFLALWGAIAPQVSRLSVNFESDYRAARTVAARDHKPIAVFVGQGANGWKKLVREGELSTEARQNLTQNFVPVYVDQDTNYGQQLAAAFSLSGKSGLVISDRTGGLMAFRHEGDLAAADLDQHLTRFADPSFVLSTTEGAVRPAAASAPVVPPAPVYVAPAPQYFQTYANPFQCQT